MTGLWVALTAALSAVAFGGWRRLTDGKARPPARARTRWVGRPRQPGQTSRPTQSRLAIGHHTWSAEAVGDAAPEGAAVTLVQFSSPQCAPCRATHRLLAAAADLDSAISHVEIDAAERLDLARQHRVRRTPTTLVLDAGGRERHRFTGPPRPGELSRVIAEVSAVSQPQNH
jgi:thiol-disulfide isomerase/thioredoxin